MCQFEVSVSFFAFQNNYSNQFINKYSFILFIRELDLSSNFIRGPLTRELLPLLKSLDSLNLGKNILTSVHTGALESFPFLTRLTLRHNQIDVLQDHAFSGLASLQMLDLSNNGIIAISGASLKHLSRLLVLNLTHNFLRYVVIYRGLISMERERSNLNWFFVMIFKEH